MSSSCTRGCRCLDILCPRLLVMAGCTSVARSRSEGGSVTPLAGFDPFALAVPPHSDLPQWRDRLDKLGEPHGGIVVGHIGWVIAGVHDPDGIEVRLYTVERHDGQ